MKTCSKCGTTKPFDQFYREKARKDGRGSWCIDCRKQRRRQDWADPERRQAAQAYYRNWSQANKEKLNAKQNAKNAKNPDQNRERARRWNADNPDRHRLRAKKHKHSRRALEKATSVADVDLRALWNGLCALCEGAMDWDVQYPDPLSKSVDHIVPIKRGGGHVQSNVQWAHLKCNLSKGAKL